MSVPEGMRFTREHEWVLLEDEGIVAVGISDFAQEQLGDITYVQLPKEGEQFNKDDTFGVVESVKAVSDLYSPVEGKVMEVNQPLLETPELINEDPYQEGWLIKMEMKDNSGLEELMSREDYAKYVEESS